MPVIAVVPAMQPMGRGTAFVQDNKERVLHRSAPCAAMNVSPPGGLHWWIKHDHSARSAKPFGEFHIFHQGNLRVPAKRDKMFASDKNRLIAVESSAMSIQKTRDLFHPKQTWMTTVEFPVKRAPDDAWVIHRMANGLKMSIGQLRISVMKNEHIACCGFRSAIHLPAAIRFRETNQHYPCDLSDSVRHSVVRGIDYDDFVQIETC